MGGADDDSNFTGLCGPHHKHKTRQDVAMIAKAKRLAGETCVGPTKRPLRSRPFPTNIRRRLNGTVENRA
jgi:hypothetical protein